MDNPIGKKTESATTTTAVISNNAVIYQTVSPKNDILSNSTEAVAAAVMKEDEDSVVPSSVPRVAKNEVNSEEESADSDVTDNNDSVNSNGEFVEGSRYELNVNDAAEGKEPENVSSNLDDVSATTAVDDVDNTNPHPK